VEALWADALPRLLIFDNGDDPALVSRHRPPAGGCRVLVTSRARRWPAGEGLLVRPLDVLERAQSVALLHALAARLSEGEAGEIAEELGDLPLALHLAGSFLARSPSVDPTEFCERVRARTTDHPALQGHGDASAPTYRQQQRTSSLEAVFQISLERLDPHDPIDALARTLLARAAGLREPGWPFPRRFLVDTAPQQEAADPDLPPPAEEAVERLLQLGLLEADGAGRLRLHRLLAGFAWTALDGPGVFAAFAPAALRWVAALIAEADEQSIARPVESRVVLDQERPLWEQFLDWGYTHEQEAGQCASARATAALGNYWVLSGAQGQQATHTRLQHALAAARRNGDASAQANTLQAIGDVQQFQGELPAAQASYAAALELYRAVGDRLGEANTRKAIGDVQQFQGELPAAQASYAAALELFRAVGDRLGEANTLRAIGDVQRFQDEREAAQASYAAALELYRVVGSRLGEANVLAAQSRLWLDTDPARSQETLEAVLAVRQALGDAYSEAADLGNYAVALLRRGRRQEALPYLQRARAIFAARGLGAQVQQTDQLIAQAQATSGEGWLRALWRRLTRG
ncbi:MAG TPA: tetratricopeptide repeat protein, partial [Roseiflexaceae bacterium]|nr:tetratricopeptide repeat protein [Roseiflexaceae bacterium]